MAIACFQFITSIEWILNLCIPLIILNDERQSMMDIISFLAPLLAMATLVERILEAIWNIAETARPNLTAMKNYTSIKQIVSLIVGIILGFILCLILGFGFFQLIPELAPNLKT